MGEEYFVPYEQSIELKELKFKERTLTYYEDGKPKLYNGISGWDFNSSFMTCVSRPTFSEAFRWFREEYNITQTIARDGSLAKEGAWAYTIIYESIYFNDGYLTYEEAEAACLKKLIEIVKQKK
jgi:hypothetical protein